MSRKISLLACALLSISATFAATSVHADGNKVTIIHTGDFHGHLIPRANVRSDNVGRKEGGLARVATVIQQIRAKDKNALLIHTGDTIQGGAEVLFTRGQAIVDVLNMPEFGINAFAPGNWEFVYGTQRFVELFAGTTPRAPWGGNCCQFVYRTTSTTNYHTTNSTNCLFNWCPPPPGLQNHNGWQAQSWHTRPDH